MAITSPCGLGGVTFIGHFFRPVHPSLSCILQQVGNGPLFPPAEKAHQHQSRHRHQQHQEHHNIKRPGWERGLKKLFFCLGWNYLRYLQHLGFTIVVIWRLCETIFSQQDFYQPGLGGNTPEDWLKAIDHRQHNFSTRLWHEQT